MMKRLWILAALLFSTVAEAAIRYSPSDLYIVGKTVGKSTDKAQCIHTDGTQTFGLDRAGIDRDFGVVSTGPTRIIPYMRDQGRFPLVGGVSRRINFQASYMRLVITTPGAAFRVVKFGPLFPPADSTLNAFWISTPADSIGNSWTTKFKIDSLRVYTTTPAVIQHVWTTAW